jgi:hypothetical protein
MKHIKRISVTRADSMAEFVRSLSRIWSDIHLQMKNEFGI